MSMQLFASEHPHEGMNNMSPLGLLAAAEAEEEVSGIQQFADTIDEAFGEATGFFVNLIPARWAWAILQVWQQLSRLAVPAQPSG